MPLSKKSRHKTAFITPDDTGEFTRMVFGLTGAPYEFARLMNLVLGPLKNKIATCYLDDVLIAAKDWHDMMSKLEMVLQAFLEAGLTLKLEKCEFGKQQVEYLGFIVSEKGIKPGVRKVAAIREFPTPTDVHESRRYLGLTSFFRRFIPNYARIARPISDLTKKNVEFKWGKEQEHAFRQLTTMLCSEPILRLYDPQAETELHTDASSRGIAGMLLQRTKGEKKFHLVYCVSKKTTEPESKYHSSRLELLAIVWSINRLRPFLLGIKFTIITDCQALTWLNGKKTLNPQMARWFNDLCEYDFEIRYRAGEKMLDVDALSRASVDNDEMKSMDSADCLQRFGMYIAMTEHDRIVLIQRSDEHLR